MSSPSPSPVVRAPPKKSLWTSVEPFVLGGSSGMFATVCIQPIDLVKVRIQLSGETKGASSSPFVIARQILKNEGFLGFYKGLSAGLLRQATYTTARLGIFRTGMDFLERDGRKSTFLEKSVGGLLAGGLGSVFGTPADLALIRMQADGTLPPEQRRNYTGVGNALIRIIREEGFFGMFKGCAPVVVRASMLNLGMLAGHDQVLEMSKSYTDSKLVQTVIAKSASGFLASLFSLPFDFVKTRIQKQKPGPDGALPYKSSIDCALKTLKNEGPLAFYKGFWTYFVRIGPHVMITLFTYDALKAVIDKSRL